VIFSFFSSFSPFQSTFVLGSFFLLFFFFILFHQTNKTTKDIINDHLIVYWNQIPIVPRKEQAKHCRKSFKVFERQQNQETIVDSSMDQHLFSLEGSDWLSWFFSRL